MTELVTSLYIVAALLGGSFALAEFRLLARFLRHRGEVRRAAQGSGGVREAGAPDGEAPTVTIQIPLYNERLAARRVILAAAAQDYPRDRFDLQVLDDSTDETSEIVRAAVEEVRALGIRAEHLRRTDRRGYKAGALAAGLEHSKAELVALFDADFTPEPGFLREAVLESGAFRDPRVAFVQARWSLAHSARGYFLAALALFLDRHFYVQKPTRAFAGQVTVFNGSAGVWRRAAIDAVGGWSSDTLTEDLDLSYRCALAGWQGRYLHDIAVPNELPEHMRSFKLQQRRWAKGNAQCLLKLGRRVMDPSNGLRDRWEEAFLLAGYGIHPVLLANLALWPWAVLYVDRTFFLVMQAVMSLATLVAPVSFLVTVRERGDRWSADALAQVVAGIVVGVGLMVNNAVGQLQGFLHEGGEFVRTPKGRLSQPAGMGGLRPYATPLHWTFFLELAVLAYCMGTAFLLIARGEPVWALPMLLWGMCVGVVISLQMTPQAA